MKSKKTERRGYTYTDGQSTMGRAEMFITCPFCGQLVKAYRWSLAGCGKRCPCGALHSYYGFSDKEIEEDDHAS